MSQSQAKQTPHKIWLILPAAGSGRRFSATELKQYQKIQGKTVLEHTLSRLNELDLAGYVLALAKDDQLAASLPLAAAQRAHFCVGGEERVHSVFNALQYLSTIADEDDWVLVHDAARPCVHVQSLQQLIATAQQHNQAAILATPVRDTLKRVNQSKIETTVDRAHLWQAQTPQMAKLGSLKKAIASALAADVDITDEASALEYMGESVLVVAGRADNIKITYPEDLHLAALILASQL